MELAAAFDVATEYWDWRGEHRQVSRETLLAVLSALGVDASTEQSQWQALERRRLEAWRSPLPRYQVTRAAGEARVWVNALQGGDLSVWITAEDGEVLGDLQRVEAGEVRDVYGRWVERVWFRVPAELAAGYHTLHARTAGAGTTPGEGNGAGSWEGGEGEASCLLILAPAWLGMPENLGHRRAWGVAAQLYSVRSRRSWGVGDLADLADLAGWAAEHEADYVLINPLHAAEPVPPMEPSPYLPTTRRFANPLYLRVEQVPEYAYLGADRRAAIDTLAATARSGEGTIDRNAAWTAKRSALQHVYDAGLSEGRALRYRLFCRREGRALADFALWCALSEDHGPDWRRWPEELRQPDSEAVRAFEAANERRVDFYRWMQWQLDDQLSEAQLATRSAGMRLGIVHDLAVGVSPRGADSWAWQGELAQGMTVGAPPDPYAQTGQDWNQPPWRPDRLAELGYEPFRDVISSVLRHSGGLRVDHIIGLFRLWWIPQGALPTEGTYVRYDHDAYISILMIEAARAGAVIIGEDLGTVEPWVRDYLRERGILGTSILWFEFDWDGDRGPLAPERWREYCLASVTTHDLPPTYGYLAGDHVRLRHRLGLLTRSLEEELAADHAEQSAWLGLLRSRGLDVDTDEERTTLALHRALAATPSRLRCLALTDAVGERRTQNQPGTVDEYPNWRVPLGGPDGEAVYLEDVLASERAAQLAEAMRSG